ncbi:ORF1 [Snake adenovirus 1]|uniref:Protein ORF1 n=1 Tax=Snake adenovirus serotype 1 TaxID=189830 RepID=ORF1_ADES1|nr:ORF1 [Snake adenovirus 1]A9CBA0.1 RecName: Full=Protein ORF1 [Snake adenovirus 1]ABA47250.1 ORF1 [Snake adenovirus 1]
MEGTDWSGWGDDSDFPWPKGSRVTFPSYQLEDPPYAAPSDLDLVGKGHLHIAFVILIVSLFVLLLGVLLACHFLRRSLSPISVSSRCSPCRLFYDRCRPYTSLEKGVELSCV